MANPRPTFQQRLFSDEELQLQPHDRIVRWVDKTIKNDPSVFLREAGINHEVNPKGCASWADPVIDYGLLQYDDELGRKLASFGKNRLPPLPNPPPVESLAVTWEPILKDERGIIVGAVDLKATIRQKVPEFIFSISELGYSDSNLKNKLCSLVPDGGKIGFLADGKLWIDGKISDEFLEIVV